MSRPYCIIIFCILLGLQHFYSAYAVTSSVHFTGGADEHLLSLLDERISKIMSSLTEGGLSQYHDYFTEEGYTSLEQLLAERKIANSELKYEPQLIRMSNGTYEARHFRVLAMDDRSALYLVFLMNRSGIITDTHFGLDIESYKQFLEVGNKLQDQVVIEEVRGFLDRLAHAYSVRDTNFIFPAYHDQAVIVVGKCLQVVDYPVRSERPIPRGSVNFESRTTKQYFDSLRAIYKRNDYVRVSFGDIDIQQKPGSSDIFRVVLKQNWNSSTYNDHGYLLFGIDKSSGKNIIIMRNWQQVPFSPETINAWLSRIGP